MKNYFYSHLFQNERILIVLQNGGRSKIVNWQSFLSFFFYPVY